MPQTALVYRFGAFELDPVNRRFMAGDECVRLTDSQFSILLYLVSHAPEVVSRDALAQAGWGGSTRDENIEQAISRLRKELDKYGGFGFIETVPNRGYRFAEPVDRREPHKPIAAFGVNDERLQAFVQGRRDLATLNREAIADARHRFALFLESNPDNAYAHTGLCHACGMAFEATRTDTFADAETLACALYHGRRATDLNPALGDAWSAYGFALALNGEIEAATIALWKAVTLEEGNFRHWVRLGYVTWGGDRLEAAQKARALRPHFALAYWEEATVYMARSAFEPALVLLQAGCAAQDRQRDFAGDYPAVGLHLARALVLGALERLDDAEEELAAELAAPSRGQLYSRECAANTWYTRGALFVRRGLIRDANAAFERTLEIDPGHLFTLAALGRPLPTLSPDDPRFINLGIARTIALARAGRHPDAAEVFRKAVMSSRLANAGWILPVEPILHAHARPEVWADLLALIRDRAT